MSLETLIKEIETKFPPSQFQWVLARNSRGIFANIFPVELSQVGKGPDNSTSGKTPNRALRTAFNNAKRNGVGPRLYGKKEPEPDKP